MEIIMHKRLLIAAFCVALGVMTTSVQARPHNRPLHSDYAFDYYGHYRGSYEGWWQEPRRHGYYVRHGRRHHARKRAGRLHASRHERRRIARHAQRRVAKHARRYAGRDTASRTCLRPAAQALLARIEAQFGRVQVISTCRPGAVIATTGRPSKHATGEAIDFNAPPGQKAAVVRWLIANHKSGGVMTYSNMSHIHVDIGPRFVSLNAGGRRYGG
jgi:uncharacterized protein YcbK (DUF882 family)